MPPVAGTPIALPGKPDCKFDRWTRVRQHPDDESGFLLPYHSKKGERNDHRYSRWHD